MDDHLRRLQDILIAFVQSKVLHTFQELNLAQLLAHAPLSTSAVAARTQTHPDSLHRFVRAAAAFGLVRLSHSGMVELTELGRLLCDRTEISSYIELQCSHEAWTSWGDLTRSVRTGEVAFERVVGETYFQHLAKSKSLRDTFNRAMSVSSATVASEIAGQLHLHNTRLIVDVGGGNATLVTSLLLMNPHLRAIVYDTADGVAGAADVVSRANMEARCRIIAGDFFEGIPDGGDAYLLKSVLHDWNDLAVKTILLNCRKAIARGGRLIVIERLMPEDQDVTESISRIAISDLTMLVCTGGRERTASQLKNLLEEAGFEPAATTALTHTSYSMLQAIAN